MRYWAIITDKFEACPGEVSFGPFATYKEAQWAIDRELEAAKELFTDGRANLSGKVLAR